MRIHKKSWEFKVCSVAEPNQLCNWKQAAYRSYKLHSIYKKTVIALTPVWGYHVTSSRDTREQGLVPIELYKCVATRLRLEAKNCNSKQLRMPFKGQIKTSTTICQRFFLQKSGHSMGILYHHFICLYSSLHLWDHLAELTSLSDSFCQNYNTSYLHYNSQFSWGGQHSTW